MEKWMTETVILGRYFENWEDDDGVVELSLAAFPLILGFLLKVFPPVT